MNFLVLPFPLINPVALEIGSVRLHWYGIAYFLGITIAWWYGKKLSNNKTLWKKTVLNELLVDSFVLYAFMGVVLGGRVGYILFYKPLFYLHNPIEVFSIWRGGMSFHGGLIGVVFAILIFSYVKKIHYIYVFDLCAITAPIGLFFGRIANFINGELFGKISDVPWAIVFPNGGEMPRHPSQLYEAGLEGVMLFAVINLLVYRFTALKKPGMLGGIFAIGYGLCRIIVEFFRMPDAHIGYLFGSVTMGMILSLPLIPIGGYMVYISVKGNFDDTKETKEKAN